MKKQPVSVPEKENIPSALTLSLKEGPSRRPPTIKFVDDSIPSVLLASYENIIQNFLAPTTALLTKKNSNNWIVAMVVGVFLEKNLKFQKISNYSDFFVLKFRLQS